MLTDKPIMFLIGVVTTAIIGVMTAFKLMRNTKVLVVLFAASAVMAFTQLFLSYNNKSFKQADISYALYCPLIYMITYNTFRYLYIRLYNMEPTYNRLSWYDPEDGRKQNWLDVLVYIIPFFVSLGFPIFISIVKQ